MSAALRSAARRLGRGCGSLLQRTHAEERFSPSRLVHTREHAPTDITHEIQQKSREMQQKRDELRNLVSKADKNCETLGNHDSTLPLALQYRSLRKVVPKPQATLRTCMRFATRANALLDAAAHATIFALVTAVVVRARVGTGVKGQTVNDENQGSQD